MRADKFLAEKFGSRTKAAEALSRGLVLKGGKVLKPSDEVDALSDLSFLSDDLAFVSNGGYKLERAFSAFQLNVKGQVFVDLGASTGGFTDCLLQKCVKKVYCVDVGESLLDERIARSSQVVVMDKTNARYLSKADFPEQIDGVTSDLSFISLTLVLPAVSRILSDEGEAFLLIKPQFEVGKGGANKNGIVPRNRHAEVLERVYDCAVLLNLAPIDLVNAPIREKKNVEYVARMKKNGTPLAKEKFVALSRTLYEDAPHV